MTTENIINDDEAKELTDSIAELKIMMTSEEEMSRLVQACQDNPDLTNALNMISARLTNLEAGLSIFIKNNALKMQKDDEESELIFKSLMGLVNRVEALEARGIKR